MFILNKLKIKWKRPQYVCGVGKVFIGNDTSKEFGRVIIESRSSGIILKNEIYNINCIVQDNGTITMEDYINIPVQIHIDVPNNDDIEVDEFTSWTGVAFLKQNAQIKKHEVICGHFIDAVNFKIDCYYIKKEKKEK